MYETHIDTHKRVHIVDHHTIDIKFIEDNGDSGEHIYIDELIDEKGDTFWSVETSDEPNYYCPRFESYNFMEVCNWISNNLKMV